MPNVDTENNTPAAMDPYNDALAALLRGRKAELGLTYQDIEDATGVNLRTIKRLFDGQRSIMFGIFIKFCAALNLDPGETVDEVEARVAKTSA